jgi:3-methyladenine DNA glycosylase AlkD
MAELERKGSEKTRKTYERHGLPPERMFGVSIADLKVIAKTIKGQQALALELYATGNVDAMYLAGIVADGAKMSREQLQSWAEGAAGMSMIYEYTVAWVTVENAQGRDIAIEWIGSKKEHVASSGWCTYSGFAATKPDEELDLAEIERLLGKVEMDIGVAQNRVRRNMNNFLIAVGGYVKPLSSQAKATARKVGPVYVDVGDTACEIPLATAYIEKMEAAGRAGKKRKTIRC